MVKSVAASLSSSERPLLGGQRGAFLRNLPINIFLKTDLRVINPTEMHGAPQIKENVAYKPPDSGKASGINSSS